MRELFDALRWHDRDERTALWWAAALGMFGVVTGYLVFAVVRHESDRGHLDTFLVAVFVAAIVSYGWERLNELIKPDHVEDKDASEPIVARAIGTFLVVLLLELFISAWHKGVEDLKIFLSGLVELTVRGAAADPPWTALIAVSVVWVALGAVMSWLLVVVIFRMAPARAPLEGAAERDQRVAFWVSSGLVGVAVGVGIAVVLLGLVLVFRFYGALVSMVSDHAYWRASLDNLAAAGPVMAGLTMPLLWLDDVLWQHPWLKVPTAVVLGGMALAWLGKRGLGFVLAAIAWIIFFPALFGDYGTLWDLLTASALLWLVPGLALGLALPLLRGPKARDWSIIAAAAGLLLAGLAMVQAGKWSLIAAAIGAFVLAVLLVIFRRSKSRDAFILLLAAVNGLAIFGLAMVPATALGVANDFVFMTTRPGLGLDHLSPAELARLAATAPKLDRDIEADPALRHAVPGRLADLYKRLQGLQGLAKPEDLHARADEVKAITDALANQREAPVPVLVVHQLGTGGQSDVLLRRAVWLDRAAGSVKRLRERTDLQVRGQSIRQKLEGHQQEAPAQLNASLGGAIGYMVTLALLAAWRIKDPDESQRAGGGAASRSER